MMVAPAAVPEAAGMEHAASVNMPTPNPEATPLIRIAGVVSDAGDDTGLFSARPAGFAGGVVSRMYWTDATEQAEALPAASVVVA